MGFGFLAAGRFSHGEFYPFHPMDLLRAITSNIILELDRWKSDIELKNKTLPGRRSPCVLAAARNSSQYLLSPVNLNEIHHKKALFLN